ncbi:MAG: glutathione peroxidase [Acidobacteria bacterium]|nr:MAG: glutathione peroxidase [Acidobacteriota bacterium]PYS15960.1 MAG: glutathione peroxidase [Acidobacteriota bacterium]
MKLLTALALTVLTGAQTQPSGVTKVSAALNFTMNSIDGRPIDLSKYHGRVVLMVNVASQCGYTPQYAGLEELYKKYAANGLSILGFPSNDFGAQEPGSDAEIAQFCKQNYGVEFDMFSKIVVRGPGQAPLYKYLTTHPKFSGQVDWNFEKFLVGRNGEVIGRFKSEIEPSSKQILSAIENALASKQ